MKKLFIPLLVLSLAVFFSCRKCPTMDELQGTWTEQTDGADKSKLVFEGSHFYFYHALVIDSFSYYLERKKATMHVIPLNNPTAATVGYQVTYHKGKKTLTVLGLFTTISGDASETNYKQ